MDINSEIVGKNFLYMLTKPEYAAQLKNAYEKLDDAKKAYFKPTVDAMAKDAKDLGLDANGKYALAWIKLWVNSYNAVTDDGPICNELVKKSAANQFGLLVYSKVRSVAESNEVSVKNIKVAAYQPGYEGMGGYAYCHYLFLTDNSPMPWTSCAFIAYMTQTLDGFSAWGKDIGCYSTNPDIDKQNEEIHHHLRGGYDEDGNLASALFVVWDSKSAYNLVIYIDDEFRSSGASTLIVYEAIKYLSDKTECYDFEGSMIHGVALKNQSFGAELTPFSQISKISNPLLKLWYWAKH